MRAIAASHASSAETSPVRTASAVSRALNLIEVERVATHRDPPREFVQNEKGGIGRP